MSSYDETDALVPQGVSVPRRPGITLISVPAAGPAVSPPSPAVSPRPVTSASAAVAHPVQPQPAATDAVSPPGVVVPQRPGVAIVQTPIPSASSALAVVQPQGPLLTDAVVPPGARVLRQPGIVLISIPVTGAAVTGTTQSQSGSGVAQPGPDYVLEPRGVNLPSRPGTVLIPTPIAGSTVASTPGLGSPEAVRTAQSAGVASDIWSILTSMEKETAREIYEYAVRHGVSSEHALELVAAAYMESTLKPNTRQPAAGLFQLTGSYVTKANTYTGGVYNWQANLRAILPAYKTYWAHNPKAVPGQAASAVEASGESASWYAAPLSWVSRHVP